MTWPRPVSPAAHSGCVPWSCASGTGASGAARALWHTAAACQLWTALAARGASQCTSGRSASQASTSCAAASWLSASRVTRPALYGPQMPPCGRQAPLSHTAHLSLAPLAARARDPRPSRCCRADGRGGCDIVQGARSSAWASRARGVCTSSTQSAALPDTPGLRRAGRRAAGGNAPAAAHRRSWPQAARARAAAAPRARPSAPRPRPPSPPPRLRAGARPARRRRRRCRCRAPPRSCPRPPPAPPCC